ncbi:uncharacterized protein [Battus philenor]|uniref:uncharacterized protein n=1 Tax=Battus philenor TaxID=42288 RepID=UPI0035D0148C
MRVFINVWLFQSPYTICYITEDVFMLPHEQHYKTIGVKVGECYYIAVEESHISRAKKIKLGVNALFFQPFVKECLLSHNFRANVVRNIYQTCQIPHYKTVFLKLILEPSDKEIIDYAWNDRLLYLIWLRVEIENAFSWLSTLGGAYSALGDYFEHCAEKAGKISWRQYKLSKLLGDEGLAERSRLYSAIAHAQKGKLKLARYIVREVASFARQTQNKQLNRMCQGVWAKLKYLRTLKLPLQEKVGSDNGRAVTNSGDGKIETDKVVCVK